MSKKKPQSDIYEDDGDVSSCSFFFIFLHFSIWTLMALKDGQADEDFKNDDGGGADSDEDTDTKKKNKVNSKKTPAPPPVSFFSFYAVLSSFSFTLLIIIQLIIVNPWWIKAKKAKTETEFVDLGAKKRVSVSTFKGKTLIDIREYYGDDDDLKPGKKGIALSIEQWKKLKENFAAIDEKIAGTK
jgi:hypothetical protein